MVEGMKMFLIEGIVEAPVQNYTYVDPHIPIVSQSKDINGVIGLSRKAQNDTTSVYLNLLMEQNKTSDPVFSLQLTGSSRDSSLTLGGWGDSYIKSG